MEAAATWALFGTAVNTVVSLLLTGASVARPSRWLVERTAGSWGLTAIVGIIAFLLNSRRFGVPVDRASLELLVFTVVLVCVAIPLAWLATLSVTWWRERGA